LTPPVAAGVPPVLTENIRDQIHVVKVG
jgi:hypothetical protein